MTHAWVLKKQEERAAQFKNYPQALIDAWEAIPEEYRDIEDLIVGHRIVDIIQKLKENIVSGAPVNKDVINLLYEKTEHEWVALYFRKCKDKIKEAEPFYTRLNSIIWNYYLFLNSSEDYSMMEDKVMKFDGDILITDPCYLSMNMPRDARNRFDCEIMNDYGIEGIESVTHYGDWSCATYDRLNKDDNGNDKQIGEFCSDSGMVCVCDLESVLKFNPQFDCHVNNPRIVTWIKNFKGTARIKITEKMGKDHYLYYVVSIVGRGKDKETGAPIKFYTKQTGF